MGRNGAQELARIVGTIGAYLDRAEQDGSLALSYEAIERATGVSRGHLSRRKEPEILALVARVAALRRRHNENSVAAASHTVSSRPSSLVSALSDEALAKVHECEMREVGRLLEQWVSRHARSEAHDAPLALHDADELVRRLRPAIERLRPLVEDWNRRHGILAGAGSEACELQLSLEGAE